MIIIIIIIILLLGTLTADPDSSSVIVRQQAYVSLFTIILCVSKHCRNSLG